MRKWIYLVTFGVRQVAPLYTSFNMNINSQSSRSVGVLTFENKFMRNWCIEALCGIYLVIFFINYLNDLFDKWLLATEVWHPIKI